MCKQEYGHTSLVPLRCKPSCQSGPNALPGLSDAATCLSFSLLSEGRRWRISELTCLLHCPQNSDEGFSIKRNMIWLPKGKTTGCHVPKPINLQTNQTPSQYFKHCSTVCLSLLDSSPKHPYPVMCLHGPSTARRTPTAPGFWGPTADLVA